MNIDTDNPASPQYQPDPDQATAKFLDAYSNEVKVGDRIIIAMRHGNQADLCEYEVLEIGTYSPAWTRDQGKRYPAIRAQLHYENGRELRMRHKPSILKEGLTRSLRIERKSSSSFHPLPLVEVLASEEVEL